MQCINKLPRRKQRGSLFFFYVYLKTQNLSLPEHKPMVYAILIICLIIGVPVAFSIVAALSYFMAAGEFPYNLRIVATQMFGGMRSYPLLAIPLFILAGDLRDNRALLCRLQGESLLLQTFW